MSNHDVEREVSRYGGGELGLARAKAMALVMLALPGAVFVYNGEELGLPNVDLPDEVLQDPTWERSGHEERGRDGCRVPMPWSGDTPPFGFSDSADTWLPMPSDWATLTVAGRRRRPRLDAVAVPSGDRDTAPQSGFQRLAVEFLDGAPDVVTFRCGDGLVCVLNAGAARGAAARRGTI